MARIASLASLDLSAYIRPGDGIVFSQGTGEPLGLTEALVEQRAGFSGAEQPERARALFDELVTMARARHREVATGSFGASMRVALVNEGPVTFWLETQ